MKTNKRNTTEDYNVTSKGRKSDRCGYRRSLVHVSS